MQKFIIYEAEILEELIKSFQVALVTCDKDNVIKYQTEYRTVLSNFALEIALNIQYKEYRELFKKLKKSIYTLLYSSNKEIFIALILQSKKDIENYESFRETLNGEYLDIEKIESSSLMLLKAHELKTLYMKNKLLSCRHTRVTELRSIAQYTQDIELAKYILEYIEDNKKSTENSILSNIVRLSGKLDSKYISIDDSKDFESYMPLLFDGYTEEDLNKDLQKYQFNKAIKMYYKDPVEAQKIIDSLEINYAYCFKAFIAYKNNDIKTITSLVKELNDLPDTIKFKITPNYDRKAMKNYFHLYNRHDQIILRIARMIAKKYPSLSDEILSKTRVLQEYSLGIQVDIAISYFKENHTKGLKYIQNLDVDYYKKYALEKLIYLYDDKEVLKKLLSILDTFKIPALKYEILYLLNKKIKVPLNLFIEVSNEIMPYDYLYLTNCYFALSSNEKDFFEF